MTTRDVVYRVALALGSVFAAFLARLALEALLAGRHVYILFVLPVLVTSLFGGPLAGSFALAASLGVLGLTSTAGLAPAPFADVSDAAGMTVFTLVGAAVIALEAGRQRARRRADAELARRQRVQTDLLSELKRAEHALRDSEARFRQIADAMPQIVWSAPADGCIDYYNRRGSGLTGIPPGEPGIDEAWRPLVHPDDRAEVLHRWHESLRTGGEFQVEFRLRTDPDAGTHRWHLGRATATLDAKGRVTRWFGTATDIHDQKRAEEALREAHRLKDEFLATLSHELRTPLNSMYGWAHILREGGLDEETRVRALESIVRNVEVQDKLIGDLLDVSRIAAGKVDLKVRPTDLRKPLEAAIETVRPSAGAKEIQVRTALEPDAGLVLGDPDRLQQVFWNLLSNAVKFTPPSGSIDVRLSRTSSHAEVTVLDTGEGIGPDFLPFVFERFRQADHSQTRARKGLGLGLAIGRHLVELHGGSIHVASPGRGLGANFMVRLPVFQDGSVRAVQGAEPAAVDAGAAAAGVRAAALQGLRVMVVDDEKDSREVTAFLLERNGAQVVTAASAAEAMERMAGGRPDVLVSDIEMPDVDGYGLIEELRQRPPEQGGLVPAVALTAHASGEDRARALRAGFQLHVSKPAPEGELVAAVARLAPGAQERAT